MPYEVTIEKQFCASHHLLNYKGACERLHGHNYVVRLTALTHQLDEAGLAVDFKVMKQALQPWLDQLDHSHLNDNPLLQGHSPSSERIAYILYTLIKPTLPQLVKVAIAETPNQWATYYEPITL
jgi:6-pyruvoyltetrahydropterin/6-carboxytetrahydropterin synthase